MKRYEEWKKDEIARIEALDVDGVIDEVMINEYETACNYCLYSTEKSCGSCTEGIRAYFNEEV